MFRNASENLDFRFFLVIYYVLNLVYTYCESVNLFIVPNMASVAHAAPI